MKQRIISAVIALLALFLVLFLVPPIVAQAVIFAAMLAGAWEWSAFLGVTGQALRWLYVLIIAALLAAASLLTVDVERVFQLALVWWLIALVWTFFFPTPIPRALRWVAGALLLVPLYVALVLLYTLNPLVLLFALAIVWLADIGAFFVGRAFGRVKLAPQISPGKTWEGAIGGLVAVALLAWAATLWSDARLTVLVPFCLAVASLSIIGDLTVSMFKRTAGLKDSGKLFPGHGGVLDRMDSIAAALPLFALGIGLLELT